MICMQYWDNAVDWQIPTEGVEMQTKEAELDFAPLEEAGQYTCFGRWSSLEIWVLLCHYDINQCL